MASEQLEVKNATGGASAEPHASAPPRASAEQWARERERGSATLMAWMIFLSLKVGRPFGRCALYVIAAYYLIFAPAVRRSSIAYLTRVLGRKPTVRDRYAHVFAFSSTILDRLYVVNERYDLFAISVEGKEVMDETIARGKGAFLLGAHLGSFDMTRAFGSSQPGLRVAAAMYEHHASRLAALVNASSAASPPEIIPLGRVDTMLRIHDTLDAGGCVGMLADRSMGDSPAEIVNFFGWPALFPSGPMRAAAALRRPVIFMTGLYRGGNRYHVVFRKIADFSQPSAGGRSASVHAAIVRYVETLEEYCRGDPYNWFNFYDFWHGAENAGDGARNGGR